MWSALTELYEALVPLNEHQSTTKTVINSMSQRIVKEWMDWAQQYMQTTSIPWLTGLNYQNKYQAMLGFCVLLQKEVHDGMSWDQIREKHTFTKNYTIFNESVDIEIYPNERSNYNGIFHPKINGDNPKIEIVVTSMDNVVNASYKTSTPFTDPNFQYQNFTPHALYKIDGFIYRRQFTLSHELEHFLQNLRKWKIKEVSDDYDIAEKLNMKSPLGRFRYLTTEQEVDAKLSSAYNYYRHVRKRISFIDAIFFVMFDDEPDLESPDCFTDVFNDDFVPYDGLISGFVFMWIIFDYVPARAKKPWMKALVAQDLPRYRKALRRDDYRTNRKILHNNFKNIISLCNEFAQTNNKYNYQAIFDHEYNKRDPETIVELFSVNVYNDHAVEKIKKLYHRWIDKREVFTLNRIAIDSPNVPIFPDKFKFLYEALDIKSAEQFLSAALRRYNRKNSDDFFETIYDTVVKSDNPYKLLPATRIVHEVHDYPIRIFVFYFIVFLYLQINDIPEYQKPLNKTLQFHVKQMKQKQIYRNIPFILAKRHEIRKIYEEYKDEPQEEIDKQFGEIDDPNGYFVSLLFIDDYDEN